MIDALIATVAAHKLPPPFVSELFDFEDAPEAMARLKSGKTVGKVVLEVRS
jgi:D-arabinose 1-dehydrogenase-like Zn-dependent alcohol dehydrogenase